MTLGLHRLAIICDVSRTDLPRSQANPDALDASWEHVRGPATSRLLVEVGEERGIDAARLLAGSGLSADALRAPTTVVTAGQELLVATNLCRELDDVSGLGLELGRRLALGDLGIWAFALISSASYGEALRVGLRYSQLTAAFVAPELDDRSAEMLVTLHDEHLPVEVRELLAERDLAATGRLLQAVGIELDGAVLETRLSGERARVLDELFVGVDVRGGRASHQLRVPVELVARPMPLADAKTWQICVRECELLLETRRRRTAVSAIVRARLVRTPAAMPSLSDLARELHTSPRSLRRRLEEEGTSYRALREEVATTLAVELLTTVSLTVAEVASRLGYSDATSFAHAFTRWTGVPPSAYRKVQPRVVSPREMRGGSMN